MKDFVRGVVAGLVIICLWLIIQNAGQQREIDNLELEIERVALRAEEINLDMWTEFKELYEALIILHPPNPIDSIHFWIDDPGIPYGVIYNSDTLPALPDTGKVF